MLFLEGTFYSAILVTAFGTSLSMPREFVLRYQSGNVKLILLIIEMQSVLTWLAGRTSVSKRLWEAPKGVTLVSLL